MKRSKHNLSHSHNLTCNIGALVPCACVEVLPGDTFNHSTAMVVRTTPLVAPVMHPVHARIHHWFVPSRLLWDGWEEFITGQADTDELPHFALRGATIVAGSIDDYLGLPVSNSFFANVNALPYRAFNLICNEWYLDEQLNSPRAISKDGGADTVTSRSTQNIAWSKDRFTSASTSPQLGSLVTVPIGS